MRAADHPLLSVEDLTKRFGLVVAAEGVSFAVGAGEAVAMMGPSGCGKSTVLRCINRLIEPDSGDVMWRGRNASQFSPDELCRFRRKVGFVFQQFHLINRLTALENVMLGLVYAGMNEAEAAGRARTVLAEVGLERASHRLPEELSGGEKQRVAIARTLALQPDLMLLDEPTASLDPILVDEVFEVLTRLVATRRTALVIATHEVDFALRVADWLILMEEGRIVEQGVPVEILSSPRSRVGQRYQTLWQRRASYRVSSGRDAPPTRGISPVAAGNGHAAPKPHNGFGPGAARFLCGDGEAECLQRKPSDGSEREAGRERIENGA